MRPAVKPKARTATDLPDIAVSPVDTEPAWAQWRGENRDGISQETGLLKVWPADGPPVAWQSSGLGGGYSSVAIAGGRIVTMGKFGNETRMVAINLEDGAKIWEVAVGGGDAPNCTPTIDGDYVYGLSHGGDLLCAEFATGKEVWRKSFPRDFGGQMMSVWGYSESPLVDGDRLIVTPGAPDAAMAALDKRTGEVIWKSALPPNPGPAGKDGAAYSSIVTGNGGGVKQYVQLVGRGVIGVEAETGRFLWGYNRVANTTANVPTPIVSGDLVFCSSGYDDGGSALLRLTGNRGQVAMQEVWYKTNRELQNHHGGMILIGDYVYMGHGHNNGFPVCFDLKTGRDMWRPGRGPGSGSAAVACADGHLYFRYENGTMALIEASPKNFQLKGKFDIAINNGKSWAHPVVFGGRLYLRDQDEMICYDIRQ
ncbi:MAG TPA: polyvinylalcohol dehydrogenase [Planctomycetaceae bacterium]|nr:polyvinylalcohol dehydrogenase [Planctomycetaceae bacterium]